MAQIKIYALRSSYEGRQKSLSDIVHGCVVDAFALPKDKRFHRFILLEKTDFFFPEDRSDRYIIIEISCFEGRSVQTKKKLVRLLFERLDKDMGISAQDIEITISETPKENWGIRGLPADELQLNYKVEK